MKSHWEYLFIWVLVTGCAKGARTTAVEGPAPREADPARLISYRAASAPTAWTYEFADTTNSEIKAGPVGTINVAIANRGVALLNFTPASGGQNVTFTLQEFSGTFSNSAGGGATTATASDMKGPASVFVTPRGVVTVTQRPELTPAFRAVSGTDNLFRRFFARVPARTVEVGATWTDTLTTEEVNDGITSRLHNIMVSTYERDSTVAGRTLYVITSAGERTLEVSGKTQGMEIVQKLRGQMNALTLWDPQLNGPFYRDETAALSGTFDLPAMNMTNMPITARGRSLLVLKTGTN